ncbi:TatD family hydrolase [Patescibacteria group bacterium]
MLIDSHCHLNFSAYKDDIDDVLKRTLDAGMKIINVGSQGTTSERAVKMAIKYPGKLFAAVALHPIHLHSVFVDKDEVEFPFQTREEKFDPSFYDTLAKEKETVAIGETGLDYYHIPENVDETSFKKKQKDVFIKHLEIAEKRSLPVILHCRSPKQAPEKAYVEMLDVLNHFGFTNAVLHCYSSTLDVAKKYINDGFRISFTGIVTYPNAKEVQEAAKYVPLDRMMVETDAPYLAPQEVRGQRNEPLFVKYIAEKIAELKGISFGEVERQTTKNAEKFFKLL